MAGAGAGAGIGKKWALEADMLGLHVMIWCAWSPNGRV